MPIARNHPAAKMVIGKLPLNGWAVIISTAEIDKLTPYSFLPSVQNTTAHQSRPVYRFHIILYGTARRHRRTTWEWKFTSREETVYSGDMRQVIGAREIQRNVPSDATFYDYSHDSVGVFVMSHL